VYPFTNIDLLKIGDELDI